MLYDKLKLLDTQKEQAESELRVVKAMVNNVPSADQIEIMVDDILEMSPDTPEGRKTIVDMMVSKIYLFDDKIVITFKAPDGSSKDIPLSEIKKSPKADCILSALGSHYLNYPNTRYSLSVICSAFQHIGNKC